MQESFLARDKLLAIEFMFHKYQSDLVHDKKLLKVENKQGFFSWLIGHKSYRNLTIGELIKEELDLFSNNYATAVKEEREGMPVLISDPDRFKLAIKAFTADCMYRGINQRMRTGAF